ncbi:MAG: hypothetical protein GXP43_01510 [bacterium]|nr:hypothetical protein [bacterium]
MTTQPVLKQEESYSPRNKKEEFLVKALAEIVDKKEMANFLRDILTVSEIEEIANRLYIAKLLAAGRYSYMQIAQKAKTSTTTVTRVAHWLYRGCGGYFKVFFKNRKKKQP